MTAVLIIAVTAAIALVLYCCIAAGARADKLCEKMHEADKKDERT